MDVCGVEADVGAGGDEVDAEPTQAAGLVVIGVKDQEAAVEAPDQREVRLDVLADSRIDAFRDGQGVFGIDGVIDCNGKDVGIELVDVSGADVVIQGDVAADDQPEGRGRKP